MLIVCQIHANRTQNSMKFFNVPLENGNADDHKTQLLKENNTKQINLLNTDTQPKRLSEKRAEKKLTSYCLTEHFSVVSHFWSM